MSGGPSAGESGGSTTGEVEPEDFGSIRIELEPADGNINIFKGTTEVTVTVHYDTCLQDFYLKSHTTYTQDGIDGTPVFAAWKDRLCTDFASTPDCEVTAISQTLSPANEVYALEITYKINDADPAKLAYHELRVGPLPVEAFASCGDGLSPFVELRQSGLFGRNAEGIQIWRPVTLPAQPRAYADQDPPLSVELEVTNAP